MYTAYSNYVNLQNNNHEQQTHTKMLATSPAENMSCAHLSHREVEDNEQQIHTKMLEQGTLHKCAMLRYNRTRQSSADEQHFDFLDQRCASIT